MAEIDAKIQQDIKGGKYNLELDGKKQRTHIKGSPQYNKRVEEGRPPSYLTISEDEAAALKRNMLEMEQSTTTGTTLTKSLKAAKLIK